MAPSTIDTSVTTGKVARRKVIPTVTALSIGCALIAGWSLSGGGCAGPVVIDPIRDFGTTTPQGDGGPTTTSTRFAAAPSMNGALLSDTPPLADYQQWKRDPNYVVDGTDQYMFYAGSSYTTELWSLALFKATGGASPPNWPNVASQVLRGQAGSWDAKDLTAPSVYVNSSGSPKFVLYYAGNGDSTKPDYVTQIGRATSTDGTTWVRSSTPALPAPAFSGTTANDSPTTQRPDGYGVTDPCLLVDGSSYVLYYAGLDCTSGATGTCTSKIFRSVSTDGGMTFPPGDAITIGTMPDALGGVAGPSVIQSGGLYVLAYTAVASPIAKNRLGVRQGLTRGSIGIATGTDGKSFTFAASSATAPLISSGGNFYTDGATAPTLYTSGTNIKLFFGGLQEQGGTFFSIIPADLTASQQ